MNVVRCCCISYNQLFQASFVATLFRTCRSFPNNVQPSRKRPHRGFQNPEVLPSKLQRNPAIPKFVSEPPELYHGRPQTSTPQLKPARSDASVKTSYSQSFHLAIGNHGQFLKLESQPTERGAPSGKIHPSFSGRLPCVFWSAVR